MNRFTTVESKEIHNIFQNLFDGEHEWVYQKSIPGEVTIHVTKKAENDIDITGITVVNRFDVRPYPPAKRRNLVFEAFDDLKPG